ncbi:helix-turn-helix domain-containing protein [Thermopolyspora sp. NPDC052614]|uniref:TetR/AcrR family transcriptional regulator n=1 Tax=Thermopolyspora sp. NPDC052614 TaxID=3155682 RepID=UPI003414868F
MAPKAQRTTALRADAARNRARLLSIARELLAAGDESLQLNTIARLAGVGVGTVYRHFPNRDALLKALAAERFRRLADELLAAAADEDVRAGLHRAMRSSLRYMLADEGIAVAFQSSGDGDAEVSATWAEVTRTLAALLDRARDGGVLRADVGMDDIRRLLCGVGHAVRIGDNDAKNAEMYLDILIQGLRPHD